MNKRHLRHLWRWFSILKPRYFLLAASIASLLFVSAMRHNSQHMSELRSAVYAADKNGGDVKTALGNLQIYVTAHMNTGLSTSTTAVYPPIQLQYTYERLVAINNQQLQSGNGDLYTQAQAYCQAQNGTDFSGRNRVPCIEQYVQAHGVKASAAAAISPSLYQFDFIAPKWSPDLAGWSLLAMIVLFIATIIKFFVDHRIKKQLGE